MPRCARRPAGYGAKSGLPPNSAAPPRSPRCSAAAINRPPASACALSSAAPAPTASIEPAQEDYGAAMEEIYCFAGNPLDRVSERRRDAGWIASLLDDPETRLLPLHGLKPLVRHASPVALDW